MEWLVLGITAGATAGWFGLLLCRGWFWRADQALEIISGRRAENTCLWTKKPYVVGVIPARNEGDVIAPALLSLLTQTYDSNLHLVLVDDQSSDDTASVAARVAAAAGCSERLTILPGVNRPAGWTGKLWAMQQGVEVALRHKPDADYLLFTDADILHHKDTLYSLVVKAEQCDLLMVSLMVKLHCRSLWEKLLIPAFVYFFQKLYPFSWVNDPTRRIAAAAGGCMLVRRQALEAIGGLSIIRTALIDDCALARAVKHAIEPQSNGIWLGLTDHTVSLRSYPDLRSLWDMVARSAYNQLGYSPFLLVGTVLGMILLYLGPLVGILIGVLQADLTLVVIGAVGWGVMQATYVPTLRLYGITAAMGLILPLVAFLYTLMSLDSARHYYQGQGGLWKGRLAGGLSKEEERSERRGQ